MKKITFLFAALLLLTSCEIEFSNNGKLDGFWQLIAVDTLATQHTSDLKTSGRTWAFQGRLLEMRDTKGGYSDLYFSFEHRGDSLFLDSPYLSDRDADDIKITDVNIVSPYGVNGLKEGFEIESLSNNKLILRSKTLRLMLRKI
ncbi:MAG: lipocalin-like domain-containing protein [Segatella oris]|uniref:lipocalin-like domain-containing protein n=1 Tax=Segatella oris TaxID=28135 RepID=UPI003FA2E553